ncbi:hypothetical protein [Rummeliibacillus sp. BSL5]
MGNFLSILAIILVIPLGIATNLLTPKVINWYSNYSNNTREKRIIALKKELEEKRNLLKNANRLIAYGVISILKILILTTLSSLGIYLQNFYNAVIQTTFMNNTIIFFGVLIMNYTIALAATRDAKLFGKIYNFEEYEKKVQESILKLENKVTEK